MSGDGTDNFLKFAKLLFISNIHFIIPIKHITSIIIYSMLPSLYDKGV